jgi:hypothetical protein
MEDVVAGYSCDDKPIRPFADGAPQCDGGKSAPRHWLMALIHCCFALARRVSSWSPSYCGGVYHAQCTVETEMRATLERAARDIDGLSFVQFCERG